MDTVVWVYMTMPDTPTAERIALTLVEERLAACANILPGMNSVYRWKGAVETAREAVLIAKTRADRFPALETRVRALHPYECPAIVALPIAAGHEPFLEWIRREARP